MKKMLAAIVLCGVLSVASLFNVGESAAASKYNLAIGMNSVEGDVPYYLADYFKEALEAKSNGAVRVDLYPGGQMGGDSELIENVKAGALAFYCGNISNTVPYVSKAAVMDSHYDFDDLAHFRRFIDSDFMAVLNEEYVKSGMRIAAVAEVGMRQLMSNKTIGALKDMEGLKVRVMQNKYHLAAWKALGAAPTPMD